MNEIQFNKSIRDLNKRYFEIFNTIPKIQDYSCSREEYVEALTKSVEERKEIETFLKYIKLPKDGKTII